MYKVASRYFIYTLGLISLRNALKKKKDSIDIPSFRGIVEVKHKLNGRIRFKIPGLKGNKLGFDELKSQLNKIENIYDVEANHITASLLIKHTENIEPTLIVGILIKLLGLEKETQNPPQALFTREFKNMKKSVSLAVNEKTYGIFDLKSLMFLLFISLGTKKILENPKVGPNGFSFLWWGFAMIR